MISKNELSQLIKKVSEEWLYDPEDFVCYWDVNSGSCGEFALSVKEKLPSDSGVVVTSTGEFLEEKGLEAYGDKGEYSNHVWLMLNGEHFDIERPEGVKHFMDLPYFQREVKIKELGVQERELYRLITANPENYEELIYNPFTHK